WAKNEDGTDASPHSDGTVFIEDFVEVNAWQSLWMVGRDADGLAALFGGKDAMITKLGEMFEKGKDDFDQRDPAELLKNAGTRPYYWAANEPDIDAPYLFARIGRPDLTQKW